MSDRVRTTQIVPRMVFTENEDKAFMQFAKITSANARCKSRKLGCVLVCDSHDCDPRRKMYFGWNGPPETLNECDPCPREESKPGTELEKCRAVHAERRCILAAAWSGASTENSILYSYMGVPCKECMLELIEAGVREIVCIKETYYDELSKELLKEWVEKGGIFRVLEV